MTTETTNQMPTPELVAATKKALQGGHWSRAQKFLEDLGRRDDNDEGLDLLAYPPAPEAIRQLIIDRVELVNARAEETF